MVHTVRLLFFAFLVVILVLTLVNLGEGGAVGFFLGIWATLMALWFTGGRS